MQPHEQDDTGVDVGSNETGSARTSADPGRPGRLRGLAAAVLVAVAGLLALPLPLHAQSQILVSNVGQNTGIHSSLNDTDLAQAFTTGSNSAGYTLTSVEINIISNSDNARTFTVSIHSNSSGAPGASLGTLSNPASLETGVVHAFTTRGIALAASTTYFVVIDRVGASSPLLTVSHTASDAQDPGRASGWSIGNDSLERAWNSSGSWTSEGQPLKIRVKGYNPRVSNASISIADASAAENDGHLMFEVTLSRSFQKTVKVDFETISGGTATEGVDYHARRTYTHVILEGDKTAQMGFALIEDTVAAAGETVKVRLSNAREFDAYGNVVSFLDITRAEATGTITAPTTTTTNVPGLTIRIKDATGDEDDGYLDFRVRLSRKHDDYVCYDFETISGGTATEGMDYLKFPKATYWMQIGKRVDKPFVRIIDDRVNDNGETVKVKISNARLCNDASQTLSITRAEATGTIRNTDPLPPALMARFGRTVARAGGGGQETVLNFAHFANGTGTTSDLVFVNVSTRPSGPGLSPYHAVILPSRPTLYFYDQEGNLLDPASVVDLTGDLVVTEDGALSIQTEMEPLGELTISTHGRGELVSGSVKVVSEGPLGGVLRYALPGIGVTGVGASPPVQDALFPVRQEGGLDTAAAIRNLSESDLVVTCRLMKEGAVLEETQIPLAANGQEAQYIEEMFTFTGADVSDFVGSVRCTVPAEGKGMFTGVAVEIDVGNRILTTLPVVPVQERMDRE